MWLPVDARGQLDQGALRDHMQWLIANGVHGFMGLGSSGRFAQMDVAERQSILTTLIEIAGPLPVIANISDIRPKAIAALACTARETGAAAVAVMPPSFYKVSDADQLAFFRYAADVAKIPVLLYNFPELTGNRISLETIAAFADNHDMAGIKQSGGEFEYHKDLIDLGREKNFAVYSGSDIRLPETLPMGAAGCIGGLVNIVPEIMVGQFNHFRNGGKIDLVESTARMAEVARIVNQVPLPCSVMAGVAGRGWCSGSHITVLSSETLRSMEQISEELRSRFMEWGMELGPYAFENSSAVSA